MVSEHGGCSEKLEELDNAKYKYYSTVSYFTDPHDYSATTVAWRCRLLACSVELGVKVS